MISFIKTHNETIVYLEIFDPVLYRPFCPRSQRANLKLGKFIVPDYLSLNTKLRRDKICSQG